MSLTHRDAHSARSCPLALAYSRGAIYGPRVQSITCQKTNQLISTIRGFINDSKSDTYGPLITRNIFRALTTDIVTAFVFEGTEFLQNVSIGANTMQDLSMHKLNLSHEDKPKVFFFVERETEMHLLNKLQSSYSKLAHADFEHYVASIIRQFEARHKSNPDLEQSHESGLYNRLLSWKDPASGKALEWSGVQARSWIILVSFQTQSLDAKKPQKN